MWSSLWLATDCRLQSDTSGWARLQGAGVSATALLLTGQVGTGSALLAGCVWAGLRLIVGGRLDCLGGVSPCVCRFRRGGSSSWNAGSVWNEVCISRIGTSLHHAVRGHRGVYSGGELELSSERRAAEVRRGSEARGAIWLPLVRRRVQGQQLEAKKRDRISERLRQGRRWFLRSRVMYLWWQRTGRNRAFAVWALRVWSLLVLIDLFEREPRLLRWTLWGTEIRLFK